MSYILEDFSPSALIGAIEANQFEFSRDLARSPQVEMHEDPDIVWFVTGRPFPRFNRVLRAHFDSQDVDARVEAALAPFRSRNVPMVWHTGPTTRPADLGDRLIAHGLKRIGDEPGMALDLRALPASVPASGPSTLTIERVADTDRLREWAHIHASAFASAPGVAEARRSIEADLGLGVPCRRLYIGLLGEEPVAASLLFLGAGVAGIYSVGTVPTARGQGIGRAMTMAPLTEARALGYRIGVLHASPMGMRIYQRLGFREYCRLCCYVRSHR
jgi:GNAT superfamily N-acetyltransferase